MFTPRWNDPDTTIRARRAERIRALEFALRSADPFTRVRLEGELAALLPPSPRRKRG